MKKVWFILLLIFLCYSYTSHACDCATRKWSIKGINDAIKLSDLIFIGERLTYSRDENFEENYSFKIIEAIKGNIKVGDIIHGSTHNSCSGIPDVEGLWIIYATLEEDGLIDFAYTGCGQSRSLSGPFIPVPAPHLDNEEYYKEHSTKLYPEYLKDWQNEYILLQSFKNQNALVEVKDNSWLNITVLSYIAIALALIAVIIAVFKR